MDHKHPFVFDSGYSEKNQLITTLINWFTATILLILALPVFIIVPILIKLTDGGPVFYSGERLGRNKKIFMMYKFRTLAVNAEQQIGAELVSTTKLNLVTPIGRFLRDTRLDELPQLLNVLKGDMDIIGPRPEREAVYEQSCKSIPWYDKRFTVKPGVIGYSQLFTPHSASKKSRALIDNFYLGKKHQITSDLALLVYAFSVLTLRLIKRIPYLIYKTIRIQFSRSKHIEKRSSERVHKNNTHARIWLENQPNSIKCEVININQSAMLVKSTEKLDNAIVDIEVATLYRPLLKRRHRYKSLHCSADLYDARQSLSHPNEHFYVITFGELTPLNKLKLHKYFLEMSIS